MLSLKKLDHHNVESFFPLDEDARYLCSRRGDFFTSDLGLTGGDWSLLKNCEQGCVYVDHVSVSTCYPINELDELYLILEEK